MEKTSIIKLNQVHQKINQINNDSLHNQAILNGGEK